LEHNNYLRSISSHACSRHLGLSLLDDRTFGDPMSRYEHRYAEYFRTFCNSALKANRNDDEDTLSTLLPYLKRQLAELRKVILALPREPDLDGLYMRTPAANSPVVPFQAA